MLKKDKQWVWTEDCQEAFKEIKHAVTLVNQTIASNYIKDIKINRNGLALSHILFDDDSLFYLKGDFKTIEDWLLLYKFIAQPHDKW